jgi:prevent-host-death family protein
MDNMSTSRATAAARIAFVRDARGEVLEPSSVTASDAKNGFAGVMEIVARGRPVVITRHDAPKAVMISVETYNALAAAAENRLDTLDREFDALLTRMQTPKARRGMKAAYGASGRRLGQAAAAPAAPRRRG